MPKCKDSSHTHARTGALDETVRHTLNYRHVQHTLLIHDQAQNQRDHDEGQTRHHPEREPPATIMLHPHNEQSP